MLDTFHDRDLLRKNNFGAMTLFFALAVVISHTWAAFGVESKEILMRITRSQMDLGALSVNAFFAISGYLITLSWLRTPRIKTFLMKRVLRIYPGFIVASILSLLIVAPLSGAKWAVALAPVQILKSIARMVLLSAPAANGSFPGETWNQINLSLWTIRYEFICYLLVPLVLLLAVRNARIVITILMLAALALHASQGSYLVEDGWELSILGSTAVWPKFLSYFICGMFFAVNRDLIPFRHSIAAVCFAAIIVTGIFGGFFIAMATAGVYLIFYVAYLRNLPTFGIGDRIDLSYGTYLYGWPVEKLLVYHFRSALVPWQVMIISVPIVLILAAMSWFGVESPFLRKKAKLVKRGAGEAELPAPAVSEPTPPPPVAAGGEVPSARPINPYRRSA